MASRRHSRIRPKAKSAARPASEDIGATPPQAPAADNPLRVTLSRKRALRVLIVDDDATFLDVISLHFRRAGYAVEQATGGRSALQAATRSRPDLIVTDYQMPDLDGAALARSLTELLGDGTPPIVLVTGAAPPNGPLPGIVRVFAKPLPMSELMTAVAELIRPRPAAGSRPR